MGIYRLAKDFVMGFGKVLDPSLVRLPSRKVPRSSRMQGGRPRPAGSGRLRRFDDNGDGKPEPLETCVFFRELQKLQLHLGWGVDFAEKQRQKYSDLEIFHV